MNFCIFHPPSIRLCEPNSQLLQDSCRRREPYEGSVPSWPCPDPCRARLRNRRPAIGLEPRPRIGPRGEFNRCVESILRSRVNRCRLDPSILESPNAMRETRVRGKHAETPSHKAKCIVSRWLQEPESGENHARSGPRAPRWGAEAPDSVSIGRRGRDSWGRSRPPLPPEAGGRHGRITCAVGLPGSCVAIGPQTAHPWAAAPCGAFRL